MPARHARPQPGIHAMPSSPAASPPTGRGLRPTVSTTPPPRAGSACSSASSTSLPLCGFTKEPPRSVCSTRTWQPVGAGGEAQGVRRGAGGGGGSGGGWQEAPAGTGQRHWRAAQHAQGAATGRWALPGLPGGLVGPHSRARQRPARPRTLATSRMMGACSVECRRRSRSNRASGSAWQAAARAASGWPQLARLLRRPPTHAGQPPTRTQCRSVDRRRLPDLGKNPGPAWEMKTGREPSRRLSTTFH